MNIIFLLLGLLLPLQVFAINPLMPIAPELAANSYLLYDYTSNQILVNQNADARMDPASLTKLMTAYVTFEAIKHGTLQPEQALAVPVSASTNINGESRMLLRPGQTVTVTELMHGLIVQSGSDAAITLALHIAGSKAGFVDMMNKEAKKLGMNNTHFANPIGTPEAQHYSTATDLALLAAALIRDFPQHYWMFALHEYSFNNVTQANRNRLLWIDPYADGLKTGQSPNGGYSLIGSAKRDNRRLISVLVGAVSDNMRATESQKLLNFGFQHFDTVKLYDKNQSIASVRVWKGTNSHVDVGFNHDLLVSIPKGKLAKLKAVTEMQQPILAPISTGQQLGVLKLMLGDKLYAEFPLLAQDKVTLANVFARGWDSLRLLFQ